MPACASAGRIVLVEQSVLLGDQLARRALGDRRELLGDRHAVGLRGRRRRASAP